MTFSSYVMLRLTRHLGTNEAKMFHAQFSFPDKMQSDNMLGNIVNFALAFESPSGTGGGLKSTTLSALFAYTKNKLGLRKDISLAGNKVPVYRVDAALTTAVFYTFILAIGIYFLTIFEGNGQSFLDIVLRWQGFRR